MRTTHAAKRSTSFTVEQNAIRGVVSQFRARAYTKTPVDKKGAVLLGLKRCFLSARSRLECEDYVPFIDWANGYLANLLPEAELRPLGYGHLAGIVQAKVVSLKDEILWVSAQLSAQVDQIRRFRTLAREIEANVMIGSLDRALEILDQIGNEFGESFWSIELRFAITQLTGGLEGQKAYLALLRSQFRQGLLSFVAYQISGRNEAKTTVSKFRVDTVGRITNRTSFKLGTQNYLKYRLLKAWPADAKSCASVLRCEQSGGILDIYETFVAFCQHVFVSTSFDQGVREAVLTGLKSLTPTDDFRVVRLVSMIEETPLSGKLLPRNLDAEERLFGGKIAAANKLFDQRMGKSGTDPWHLVYAGFARAHIRAAKLRDDDRCLGMVSLLADVWSGKPSTADSLAKLDKICLNFSGLPTGRALLSIAEQLADKNQPWLPSEAGLLLQSPSWGPEDRCWDTKAKDRPIRRGAEEFWSVLRNPDQHGDETMINALARAIGCVASGDALIALPLLESARISNRGPIFELATMLKLTALHIAQDRGGIVGAISEFGTKSESNRRLLPVSALIGSFEWEDFAVGGVNLAVCNALYLLWQETADERVASWLRFSTSQVLKTQGRPALLIDTPLEVTEHELVHFLRYVCVPGIMDISRIFSSSREVLEERREVLGALIQLDENVREEAQDQILTITNQLTLDDGLTIVDRSRIYVDADSFHQWARSQIEEDFQRYQDLVQAGLGTSENFDEVVRLLTTDLQAARALFFTPDNQADALLLDMLRKLREGFLTNTTFGFDYYLSKRIRHQSFVGLIRGPLEFANLITTRETEKSDYKSNFEALSKLSILPPEALAEFDQCLARFSQNFDELLASLRDSRLQVRSPEKQEGIFDVPLSAQVLVVSRAIAQSDPDVSSFTETALAVFWGAIEGSLTEARKLIAVDTKNSVATLIDQLRIDLRAIAGEDPGFVALDTAFGRASSEVQRHLDSAAGWFSRADNRAVARHFSLEEALEIAIESAMKSQRSFEANIMRDVTGDVSVPASSLILITEVIFVALDNVRRHAGLHRPGHINIACAADAKEGILDIVVESDAGDRAKGFDEQKRLEEIKNLIKRREFEKRTRREGGSGFIKLAAVAMQSDKGAIDFGFTDLGRFKLSVRYSLLVEAAIGTD